MHTVLIIPAPNMVASPTVIRIIWSKSSISLAINLVTRIYPAIKIEPVHLRANTDYSIER